MPPFDQQVACNTHFRTVQHAVLTFSLVGLQCLPRAGVRLRRGRGVVEAGPLAEARSPSKPTELLLLLPMPH